VLMINVVCSPTATNIRREALHKVLGGFGRLAERDLYMHLG